MSTEVPTAQKTRPHPYLDVAIVGLGAIGLAHVDAALKAPSARLVAVADIDSARVDQVATQTGCMGYSSAQRLFEESQVDVAIICTPDSLHVDAVRAATSAGCNVLLEKPIATTIEDSKEILRLVEAAGVAFTVGHCLRFDPKYVEVKRRISRGEIGELATVYARRQNQIAVVERLRGRVSSLLFLGVHDIDIINWYMQSDPVAVYCAGRTGVLAALGYPVDDVSFTTIKYANGNVANVESGWLLPRNYPKTGHFQLTAMGSSGVLQLDEFDEGLWIANETFSHLPLVDRLTPQLEGFINAILTGSPPMVSGAAAFSAVEVALAAEISARENREVTLPLAAGPSPAEAQAPKPIREGR